MRPATPFRLFAVRLTNWYHYGDISHCVKTLSGGVLTGSLSNTSARLQSLQIDSSRKGHPGTIQLIVYTGEISNQTGGGQVPLPSPQSLLVFQRIQLFQYGTLFLENEIRFLEPLAGFEKSPDQPHLLYRYQPSTFHSEKSDQKNILTPSHPKGKQAT